MDSVVYTADCGVWCMDQCGVLADVWCGVLADVWTVWRIGDVWTVCIG